MPRPRYANASLRRFSTLPRQQVERLLSAVGDLESTHASSLGRCVSHMEDHVEEACRVPGPCGGTPERKRYPRPDKFRWRSRRGEGNKPERCGKFPAHFFPRLRRQSRASVTTTENLFLGYSDIYNIVYIINFLDLWLLFGCGRQSFPGDSFIVSPNPAPLLRIFFFTRIAAPNSHKQASLRLTALVCFVGFV